MLKWCLTYSCHTLAMRCAFVPSAIVQRCVFAGLCTWFIYNMLYILFKLLSSSHILTKFMDAQRRTSLFFCHSRRGLCVVYVWLGYNVSRYSPVTHKTRREHMWCKVLYIADLFCLPDNIRPENITISLFFGALKLFFDFFVFLVKISRLYSFI